MDVGIASVLYMFCVGVLVDVPKLVNVMLFWLA